MRNQPHHPTSDTETTQVPVSLSHKWEVKVSWGRGDPFSCGVSPFPALMPSHLPSWGATPPQAQALSPTAGSHQTRATSWISPDHHSTADKPSQGMLQQGQKYRDHQLHAPTSTMRKPSYTGRLSLTCRFGEPICKASPRINPSMAAESCHRSCIPPCMGEHHSLPSMRHPQNLKGSPCSEAKFWQQMHSQYCSKYPDP